MNDAVEELMARERIRDVVYRYCTGVDHRDWALVRSCFDDGAVHRHGAFTGGTDDFVAFAQYVLSGMPATVHMIGNVAIDRDGDSASVASKFVAYHHINADAGDASPVETHGRRTDWIVAGRYIDNFVRRNEVWRIAERTAFHDWTHAGATTIPPPA